MLYEIMSDEFIAYGVPRGRITFHMGLNVVIGGAQSDNSIGKSTFLLAVDFCFGGNSYYTRTDLRDRFSGKNHTICFAFRFNSEIEYFSRSIDTPDRVNVCDKNYNAQSTISLDKFKSYLWTGYNLSFSEMTFRDVVSRFMRIYGKDNYNERHPLETHVKDSMRNGIISMEKMFGYYDHLKPYFQMQEQMEKKKKAANDAVRQDVYTITVPNKKQVKENNKEINQLTSELEQLVMSEDIEMSESGLDNADEILAQKSYLSVLKRKRGTYVSRKNTIERNYGTPTVVSCDYADLKHFFPDANIAKIEEVQSFHHKMQQVLETEINEELQDIESMITIIDGQIEDQERHIREMGTGVMLPRSFLERYTELTKRIELLKAENSAKDRIDEINKDAVAAKEETKLIEKKSLDLIADKINSQMKLYNDFIYDEAHGAPMLSFESQKHYTFMTPDDAGMGTGYKSMIIYDLSMLKLTDLPVIAHDSLMFNHIGYEPLEKIMELYLESGKQIFIAYDRKTAPTTRIQEILDNFEVISLSQGGNELFGYSWAKRQNLSDEKGGDK